MKQPSHVDLCAAHDRQDWNFLWRAAVPLVKFCIKRMMRHGEIDPYWAREDLLQEGMLAAGLAVRSWDTIEAKFSTWIILKARGHLIDYVNKERNGGVGGKDVSVVVVSLNEPQHGSPVEGARDDEELEGERLDDLSYEGGGTGIATPDVGAQTQEAREIIAGIEDPIAQDILARWCGFGGTSEGTRAIGDSYGRSNVWVWNVIRSFARKLTLSTLPAIPPTREDE